MHFTDIFFLVSFLIPQVLCDLVPFSDWLHLRVALKDVSIHLRYAGTGPPILLVHGYPQHSLTWHTIGPILAQNYTVLAVDLRGCGSSSIPRNDDYTAETVSDDLLGVLQFLNINQTYVFSHDKGVGVATALAFKNRSLVKRLGMSEYPLPGTGIYEAAAAPSTSWDNYYNWQLAFFAVPDVAQFFVQGREREMLEGYFYHGSYTGNSAISEHDLIEYTREISKPGFLRSGFGYFKAATTFGSDAAFFNSSIASGKLTQAVLALGGETSISPVSVVVAGMGVVGSNSTSELIPKSGHWIGDENPLWVAQRLQNFFGEDEGIPSVDLGYLTNQITIPQQVAAGATIG